jgi:outer membrane immunogenic protein
MKRLALGLVAAAIYSSSALAASPAYNWSGFYIGVNGGGAWSPDRSVFVDETFANGPFFSGNFGSRRAEGGFGGVQIGANWQRDNWLFGFEADAQGGSVRGSSLATITPYLAPGATITVGTTERLDWFSTFRGRAGFAFDRVLLYVTGGVAVGQTRTTISSSDSFAFFADGSTRTFQAGYVVGAGGEYAFTPNWSAKLEYQYIDFLTTERVIAREFVGGIGTAFYVQTNNRADYHTVRLGLNYKFGASPAMAPLVTKN